MTQAAVVGFSIGGMINRRFAIDFPNRLSALAILNSPHDRGDEAQALLKNAPRQCGQKGRWPRWKPRLNAGSPMIFEYHIQILWKRYANGAGKSTPQSYAEAAWVLATGVKELTRPTTPVNVPTIVITSENDSGSTPDMAATIAAEIDQAAICIVPELNI